MSYIYGRIEHSLFTLNKDITNVIFANGSWLTKSTINFLGKLPTIQYLHHNRTHLNRHHHQIVVTKKKHPEYLILGGVWYMPCLLGRAWVSPTLSSLYCKMRVRVCPVCEAIYRKFKLNEWIRFCTRVKALQNSWKVDTGQIILSKRKGLLLDCSVRAEETRGKEDQSRLR